MIQINFYGDSEKVHNIHDCLLSGLKDSKVYDKEIMQVGQCTDTNSDIQCQCPVLIKAGETDVNMNTVFTFYVNDGDIDYLKHNDPKIGE